MVEEYRRQKRELDERFERERAVIGEDGQERYRVEGWKPEEYSPREEPER